MAGCGLSLTSVSEKLSTNVIYIAHKTVIKVVAATACGLYVCVKLLCSSTFIISHVCSSEAA